MEKFSLLAERAEYDFEVSVEYINGTNSYWVPTPPEEIEEFNCRGIIDIGDDQTEFEKLVSLVHEIGHAIFSADEKYKAHGRILLFEESLAWYLGYDYALINGVEIDIKEYIHCVQLALSMYENRR